MKLKFTLAIDSEVARKLDYVAEFYSRSRNGQIEWLCKECIENFVKAFGPIPENAEES